TPRTSPLCSNEAVMRCETVSQTLTRCDFETVTTREASRSNVTLETGSGWPPRVAWKNLARRGSVPTRQIQTVSSISVTATVPSKLSPHALTLTWPGCRSVATTDFLLRSQTITTLFELLRLSDRTPITRVPLALTTRSLLLSSK